LHKLCVTAFEDVGVAISTAVTPDTGKYNSDDNDNDKNNDGDSDLNSNSSEDTDDMNDGSNGGACGDGGAVVAVARPSPDTVAASSAVCRCRYRTLHGGFSGAAVLKLTKIGPDGTPHTPTVVKMDYAEEMLQVCTPFPNKN